MAPTGTGLAIGSPATNGLASVLAPAPAIDPQALTLALLTTPAPVPPAGVSGATMAAGGPPLTLASIGQAALSAAPSDSLASPTLQAAPFVSDAVSSQMTVSAAPSLGHALTVLPTGPDDPGLASLAASPVAPTQPAPVPEPTAMALFGAVGVALVGRSVLRRLRPRTHVPG